MAGIIAQLTRAARVRRDRRTYGTNKCMYTLEPFDTNGFDAKVHNRYCVQRAVWEERIKNIEEEEEQIITAVKEYKVIMNMIIAAIHDNRSLTAVVLSSESSTHSITNSYPSPLRHIESITLNFGIFKIWLSSSPRTKFAQSDVPIIQFLGP